ncbi:UNVERIFIED_CONTAM: putative cytochrome c biosynthesis ccmC-like mitochondrial protein [Sesamum calycinum]|uniref:Cytochrome c biosynthesis ccmC-like mitochondrial protein n=1 Tax=Sesamum calycinum TaxID=2727403 RepID=A0AAW2JTK1_9LAMI
MAIHLSLRVAPLDLQQGGNSRIPYVHVPAARMSILVYIATAINTFLFLLTKHPLFLRSSGTGTEMGAFSTLFTLVTGGFRGRPMWGTFWVWDARLTSVFISFLIYLGSGKCLLQAFSKQACCKQGILFTWDKPGKENEVEDVDKHCQPPTLLSANQVMNSANR